MSKPILPAMQKYPAFKKVNTVTRKDDVWYSWMERILDYAFKQYLATNPKGAASLSRLPKMEEAIIDSFPEMHDDKQSINAISKSISQHFNTRLQKKSRVSSQLSGLRVKYGDQFVTLFKTPVKKSYTKVDMNTFLDTESQSTQEQFVETENLHTITLTGDGVNITRSIDIEKFKELLAAHY